MTEPELIEGIIRRDRNAFEYLVDRYQKQVIKTAFHFLGNMEDAEDLSQEIFLEIIRSMTSFRQTSTLATWINRITVNKSINALKKKQSRGIILRLEQVFRFTREHETTKIQEPSVEQTGLEHHEKRELLHAAIGSLPEKQRIAFVLHKFDDKSYKEIADIMATRLPAVESLIHRAKLNLQKALVHHFSEYQNHTL